MVLDTKFDDCFTATSKARIDIDKILESLGYNVRFIDLKRTKGKFDLYRNINYSYSQYKKILNSLESNSTIVFQYPFDSLKYSFSKYLLKIKNKKNFKTIALIHDINSIRTNSFFGKLYYNFVVKEIKFLNNFDYIICHNEVMKKYLIERGINEKKLIILGIFDYLVDESNKTLDYNEYKKVIIAGNLAINKSTYLYNSINDLKVENYSIDLYGVNYHNLNIKNINYKGKFEPNNAKNVLNYGFGLVWDGINFDSCLGNFGNYLRYNDPHKFSLYISCGIPVIVWNESALSTFVEKEKIGFTISSLQELNDIFKKLKITEYKKYCNNVLKFQKKVINGDFVKSAIKECEEK